MGDSSEQNGAYKSALTKEKDALMYWKRSHGLAEVIENYDIIPLVNRAWDKSFARKDTNMKAIRMSGWNPCNMALLTNEEILKKGKTADISLDGSSSSADPTSASTSPTNSNGSPSFGNFNLEEGLAAQYAIGLFNHITSATKVKEMAKKKYETGRVEKQRLSAAKKLGGGNLFNSQHVLLDDEVLEIRRAKDKKKTDSVATVLANKIKAYKGYEEKYLTLVSSGKEVAQYSSNDFKIVIQMLKRKEDGAIPTKLEGRKAMYETIIGRPKPSLDEYMFDLGHQRSDYDSVLKQVDTRMLLAEQPRMFSIAEELGETPDEVLDEDIEINEMSMFSPFYLTLCSCIHAFSSSRCSCIHAFSSSSFVFRVNGAFD